MTLKPNKIGLIKVYVVEADVNDEFGEYWHTFIDSIYSSKEKALARCHELHEVHEPDCDYRISEFYLDDGDDVTDETWIREFQPDDIEVYREAFPSNESIMVVVKWTHEGQKCSRGFTFYNVPSDENDETKYTFAQNVTDKLAHMLGEYLNDTYGVNLMVGQPARDKIKMKIMEMI